MAEVFWPTKVREYLHRPTVSIIIPCFNGAKFVGEALESLRSQTFRDWEAIVVNDGSTDDSEAVIRTYQGIDARIHCVSQENRGLPAARNTGLNSARGEFVIFLDADDLLMSDMLYKMVQELSLDSSFGAVSCGWVFSDCSGDDLSWKIRPSFQGQHFEKLAHGNLFPCHGVLLRRRILEQVGEFDCSLAHCHDWDLWLRVARTGVEFACISEPLVIYRMLPHSLSRNAATFYLAGKEVICRGHQPDPRVKNPAAEFVLGCRCSNMELHLRKWLLHCVGIAIAQGDPVQASALFESTFNNEDTPIDPRMMKGLTAALCFGTATPWGNWDKLYVRIGRTLLQFLLTQEERLDLPGFALQSILQVIELDDDDIRSKSDPESLSPMVELDGITSKSDPESLNVRDLIKALNRKIVTHLSRFKR